MRPEGDRGSFSIMLATFMLGICAVGVLMIDVATVYVEGRQLQNGAESAALAVTDTCITEATCDDGAGDAVAGGNALDGTVDVDVVCGTAPGLVACTTEAVRDRLGCQPLNGLLVDYVQVQTLTSNAGVNLLPGFMSRVIDPDFAGTEVASCARAAYGNPSGLTGELPLAISTCELSYWMGLFGLVNAPYPPASEAVLYFHDTGGGGPSDCPDRSTNNSNQDTPGGFGWLTTTAECEVATTLDGDAIEKQGNSVPNACTAADFATMLGQVVNIPIYSSVTNGIYDIVGYGAFRLTGYRLSGAPEYRAASPTLGIPCPSSSRCISGFFTYDPVPSTGPLVPGPSYGSMAVRLVG